MVDYCSKCGAERINEDRFCSKCGADFERNSVQTQEGTSVIQQPKKSNIKIIAVIAIIIVAIVIAASLLVLFKGDANKVVGTWIMTYEGDTIGILQFNSDGTFASNTSGEQIDLGTYKIEDGKIFLTFSTQVYIAYYSFTNNDRTLTLTPISPAGYPLVLTKLDNPEGYTFEPDDSDKIEEIDITHLLQGYVTDEGQIVIEHLGGPPLINYTIEVKYYVNDTLIDNTTYHDQDNPWHAGDAKYILPNLILLTEEDMVRVIVYEIYDDDSVQEVFTGILTGN